jgi:hypothetical protein
MQPISPIIHEDELVIFPGAALRGLCWAFKLQMNEIRLSHYCAVRNWNDVSTPLCNRARVTLFRNINIYKQSLQR